MRTGTRAWFQAGLLGVLGVAVLGSTVRIARMDDDYRFFDPLIEAKAILDKRAVEAPEGGALQRAAIGAMVDAVGDPFTVYVPPADSADFAKDLTGEYVGIGAQVTIEDGWLTVVTPLDGSPALEAGVRAGDRIVEISGQSTFGQSVDESVDTLSGAPGEKVSIVVEREGERIPIEIVREAINTVQVKGVHRRGENDWQFVIDPSRGIAYVWLTQFTPGCAGELADALESAGASTGGLRGLVLDLRWNPGGVLEEAERLADLFLREGVIVSTRGRTGPESTSRASEEGTLPEFPIVVMLNELSASASEVLAGALVENGRAVVLGTRSVGKGSVQTVVPLSSQPGAVIKVTERRYYLPSGRSLQREDDSTTWGVDPTPGFYVPLDRDAARAVVRRKLGEDVIGAETENGAAWDDPDWILARLEDPQLTAAVRAIQARIDGGAWPTPAGDQPEGDAVAIAELAALREAREQLALEVARMDRRIGALSEAGVSAPTVDLWEDGASVAGGRVEVFDASGTLLARLKTTGDDLERWLIAAGLERADQ